MIHKDDQTTWDELVAQCASSTHFSRINVASEIRRRAIRNIDAELRALRREVKALWKYAPDAVLDAVAIEADLHAGESVV